LADLLLRAFDSEATRAEMLWLALYCERSTAMDGANQSVGDLMAAWERRYPDAATSPGTLRDLLGSLRGLFTLARSDGRPGRRSAVSAPSSAPELWIRLHPDLCACLCEACDRIRIYRRVLDQFDGRRGTLEAMEPLHRAVAEAALCFNAGLFFETHEVLEHHWLHLEDGPARRFVQGLIQISVGFHHAMRGSHQGAVNQLGKGLAKLGNAPEGALGLDCDRFAREVEMARNEILAGWRQRMPGAAPRTLPLMHVRS
jgi:hypothetical protein